MARGWGRSTRPEWGSLRPGRCQVRCLEWARVRRLEEGTGGDCIHSQVGAAQLKVCLRPERALLVPKEPRSGWGLSTWLHACNPSHHQVAMPTVRAYCCCAAGPEEANSLAGIPGPSYEAALASAAGPEKAAADALPRDAVADLWMAGGECALWGCQEGGIGEPRRTYVDGGLGGACMACTAW